MSMFRQEVATIENIVEVFDGKENHGNLVLSTEGEVFQIYWTVFDNSPNSWISAISVDTTSFAENSWEDRTSFLIDVPKISFFTLSKDPLQFCINIGPEHPVRKFTIKEENLEQFVEFIKHIIASGVALPTTKEEYSLEVYKRCHRTIFVFQPMYIELVYDQDLDVFYNNIIKYSCDIVSEYDKKGVLPNDPTYPLSSLVTADIKKVLASMPSYEEKKVEESEWDSFFDEEGRFVKFEEVRRRAAVAGVDDNLVKRILPFITNVFKPDTTKKEREEITKKLVEQFKCLRIQALTLSSEQKANNAFIGPFSRVIDNDVKRTDRDLKCFVKDGGQGLKILTYLLNCYLLCFPHISYLQGMNDIFVPILTSFIPDWDDDSNPITDNLDENLAMVFWCYDGMLRSIEHTHLLLDITEECKRVSEYAVETISKVSPCTKIWLKKSGNIGLVFTFSDYVLLYKRSISDIWRIWIPFLCKDNPTNALPLFTASVVMLGLPTLCALDDWSITMMMTIYPQTLETVNVDEAIKIMLWLNNFTPKKKEEEKKVENIPDMNGFRYFRPGIIPKE